MKRYLLDTNICIYFLKGQFSLDAKIEAAGISNCYLSEITVAELKFGAENSQRKEENRKVVASFVRQFNIVPIYNCLDLYAREKARLRKKGVTVDDFDLLIGTSAVSNGLILVTNNERDFRPLQKLKMENWTQ